MTEAKLIELMKEWKNEMKALIGDYQELVAKLNAAVGIVEESKKKWWVVYKTHITVAVIVVGFLIALFTTSFIMKSNNLCIVNVGSDGKSFVLQSCPAETNPPKQLQ